jgi:hypothetical protein
MSAKSLLALHGQTWYSLRRDLTDVGSVKNRFFLQKKALHIISLKQATSQPFALDVIILVCWVLWISCNDFIFKGVPPSIYRCRKLIKRELQLLLHKATRKSYSGLKSWVQNFS